MHQNSLKLQTMAALIKSFCEDNITMIRGQVSSGCPRTISRFLDMGQNDCLWFYIVIIDAIFARI